jgi:hypothetical protein
MEQKQMKNEFKRDEYVWVVLGFDALSGEYISTDGKWLYVLLEDGKVQGCANFVVFKDKDVAQAYLIEQLKKKIIETAKDLTKKE